MVMMRTGGWRQPGISALSAAAGGLLIYEALARLPRQTSAAAEVFAAVWFGFALLTVGAHLWFALGADRPQTGRMRAGNRRPVSPPVTFPAPDERRRRQRA
jgi:hypothetical protein